MNSALLCAALLAAAQSAPQPAAELPAAEFAAAEFAAAEIAAAGNAEAPAAGDWPRYLGPEGTAVAPWPEATFAWPEAGPKVLWRQPIGGGYGGAAVADGEVYLFDHERNERDVLRVFDLDSGEAFEGAAVLLGDGMGVIRATPGPGNCEVAYLLVPFAVSSFCLAFRARRAGDPAAAARYFCEAMVHFPNDDVRKPAAAWFLADSRTQAPSPMRLGDLRDVVAMAEEHEAAFAALFERDDV